MLSREDKLFLLMLGFLDKPEYSILGSANDGMKYIHAVATAMLNDWEKLCSLPVQR